MENVVIWGLMMLPGVLAMIALPIVVLSLSCEVSRNRRLEERNAAQAQVIARLMQGRNREQPGAIRA